MTTMITSQSGNIFSQVPDWQQLLRAAWPLPFAKKTDDMWKHVWMHHDVMQICDMSSQLPSANVMAIDSHPPPTSLIGQVNLFQLSNQLSLKTPRAIAASSHASAHGKAARSLRIRPASSGRGSYPAQTDPERLRETALSLSLSKHIMCVDTLQCSQIWYQSQKYRNVLEKITNDPNLMVYTTHLWWNWDSLLLFDHISALLCSNNLI